LAAGLSKLTGQAGYTSGVIFKQATQTLDRVGQFSAPVTDLVLRVVEPTSPRATRKRAAAAKLTGTAMAVGARLAGLAPLLAKVKLAAKVSEVVTSKIGTAVATLSEAGPAGAVMTERRRFLFFKSKQTVELNRSGLTGWLNRQNVIGQRELTVSNGLLFTAGRKSWHRGTVTFAVGQNKRTITHLQSLSYPAEHYYFDRRLSNQQAVALAGGQSKPETIPGFTGRVSKTEMLCPTWAGAKRALILARLHWKDGG
jgi:hypothetical protein